MRKLFFFLMLLILAGCSTTGKLKKFAGQPVENIQTKFGKPTTVMPIKDGFLYIYETTTKLTSTEISKGQITLDPMVSPAVTKTEKIIFTVRNGIVEKTQKEIGYSRR
jgi:hypothetical protein